MDQIAPQKLRTNGYWPRDHSGIFSARLQVLLVFLDVSDDI